MQAEAREGGSVSVCCLLYVESEGGSSAVCLKKKRIFTAGAELRGTKRDLGALRVRWRTCRVCSGCQHVKVSLIWPTMPRVWLGLTADHFLILLQKPNDSDKENNHAMCLKSVCLPDIYAIAGALHDAKRRRSVVQLAGDRLGTPKACYSAGKVWPLCAASFKPPDIEHLMATFLPASYYLSLPSVMDCSHMGRSAINQTERAVSGAR